MLFNSLSFALFLPLVFGAYWLIGPRHRKWQNLLLLLASYFFYSCWDFRFLGLLVFSTLLDFFTGLQIHRTTGRARRWWLRLSVLGNLGVLGFFKYYGFFVQSFAQGLENLGLPPASWSLSIILPIGISFYTFHGLSYVFDIYRGRIAPTTSVVTYALFVSFFPLLVAGPIERATHLLPQIENDRRFSYATATDGLRQMLWGFFKKIAIADNCAELVAHIFATAGQQSGSTLAVGAVLFAFQIYADFSGYTDIALGTARLFGFELLRNFAYPYFARDIAEFWRRWHISLSSWFKDYLYFPLGGSRGPLLVTVRNVFIIFIVSGLWHGANWTFVFWGLLHALFYLPLVLRGRQRQHLGPIAPGRWWPAPAEALRMLATFALTTLAWVFFRADTLGQGFSYVAGILSPSLLSLPALLPKKLFVLILLLLLVEWRGREQPHALADFGRRQPRALRWAFYYCLIGGIFLFGNFAQALEFIYFNF